MGRGVLRLIFTLIVCVSFAACTTTKVVTVPEYHYHDSVQVRTEVDSVLIHDSIYVSTSTRNDTVTVEKYVTRYRDRIRERVDTMFVTRVDTVTMEVQASSGTVRGKAASLPQVLLVMAAVVIALLSIRKSINLK